MKRNDITLASLVAHCKRQALNPKTRTRVGKEIRHAISLIQGWEPGKEKEFSDEFWVGVFVGRLSK